MLNFVLLVQGRVDDNIEVRLGALCGQVFYQTFAAAQTWLVVATPPLACWGHRTQCWLLPYDMQTIKKRFRVFIEQSMPVVELYEKQSKVARINTNRPVDEIYKEVRRLVLEL
jgi:cystathionine beta-lyase/cystathionine gamma-synthase